MKMTKLTKLLSLILCIVLVAGIALNVTGCGKKQEVAETAVVDTFPAGEYGKGSVQFAFVVVDKDGNATNYTINTDKKTVGEALLDLGIIKGENGEYGLYVKTVNGITADYDVDKTYWAFYINDEYAMTGVDSTDVEAGATYKFAVEAG